MAKIFNNIAVSCRYLELYNLELKIKFQTAAEPATATLLHFSRRVVEATPKIYLLNF